MCEFTETIQNHPLLKRFLSSPMVDLIILLFSHFIACGVWEAIYILDGPIRNRSSVQPTTVHADTQGQNLPVFGLASLLGIELMPRIRNWKNLTFYRPDGATHYAHIEPLFGDQVVDWEPIKTHWQDLLRVVISIQERESPALDASAQAHDLQPQKSALPGVSCCVMLDNVIELNAALNTLAKEGVIPTIDELASLSSYQTRHIKHFGNYELDLSQIAAPATDDLAFELESEQEQEVVVPTLA